MAQAVPMWAVVASTALTAAGTGASIHQQRRATRLQEKADKASRAIAEIQNQRNIRKQILAGRIAQAQATVQGQAQGGGLGDSAVQGAVSSVGAQVGSNVGFAQSQIGAGNAISRLGSQARQAKSNAATFGAVAALPGQFGFDTRSMFKDFVNRKDVTEGR